MEHHAVIYGRAMHDAVSRYYQYKISGNKIDLGGLLDAFRNNFNPEGFLGIEHQKERMRIGTDALTRFFHDEGRRNTSPKFVEKEFSFKFNNIKILGRFDLINESADGIEIMDFKTSEIKTQKEADKRVKESKQLLLYSLAYDKMIGELPKRLSLYFLESGIIGTTEVSQEGLEKVKEDIIKVSEGIYRNSFEATPAFMACTYCAYNQICPLAKVR